MIYPPYYASYGDVYRALSGSGNKSANLEHFEDRSTGGIATRTRNKILDPGNSAYQHTSRLVLCNSISKCQAREY